MVDAVFLWEDIHGKGTDLLTLNALDQRIDIHELSAADIHQHHAVAHLCNRLAVDNATRGFHERDMHRHKIALGIQLVESHIGDIAASGELLAGERIVCENLAAEASQIIDNGAADATRPHDAHGEGAQLATAQSG